MNLTSAAIDDLSSDPPLATTGTRWQLITDQVMGRRSRGTMVRELVAGRTAIRMREDVSLESNGGFVQIALDLAPPLVPERGLASQMRWDWRTREMVQ